jgi:hypothetical protein
MVYSMESDAFGVQMVEPELAFAHQTSRLRQKRPTIPICDIPKILAKPHKSLARHSQVIDCPQANCGQPLMFRRLRLL